MLIKLKKVKINKYKNFTVEQSFDVESDITVLVGKNESGKSSILEAISKMNYFDSKDPNFYFKESRDYPKRQWAKDRREEKVNVGYPIICEYELDDELVASIEEVFGKSILTQKTFELGKNYDNDRYVLSFTSSFKVFLQYVKNNSTLDCSNLKSFSEVYQKFENAKKDKEDQCQQVKKNGQQLDF